MMKHPKKILCVIGLAFVYGCTSGDVQQTEYSDNEPGMIDHLMYIAPNRLEEKARITEALGIEAVEGGSHKDLGTSNALLSLGGRQYLEIAGIDEGSEADPLVKQFFFSQPYSDILTYAVETFNAEEKREELIAQGFKVSEIFSEARTLPSGEKLSYRGFTVDGGEFRGLVPFFMDWDESPQPGLTSPKGAKLKSFLALTSDPDGLREIYNKMGIKVPVQYSNKPGLVATISTAEKTIVLNGSARGMEAFADFIKQATAANEETVNEKTEETTPEN